MGALSGVRYWLFYSVVINFYVEEAVYILQISTTASMPEVLY
jgi:hypothetical protein